MRFTDGDYPPLIGLTTYVEPARCGSWEEVSAILPISYVTSVIRSGGCPVLLPPASAEPGVPLSAVDGLVVIGGPDVDPKLYDADAHPETGVPRAERDSVGDRPVPSRPRRRPADPCHLPGPSGPQRRPGRHAPSAPPRSDRKLPAPRGCRRDDQQRDHPSRRQRRRLDGRTRTEGLCHHHQAVDRLGRRMRAVGFAPDGTVEAVEVAGQEFALGVQ